MNRLDQDFWSKYGFKNNPYDTTALTLYTDSMLPISKVFVGRGVESREFQILKNILSSKGGSRLVIEGEIGVGKTTFVNYHRYLWEKEATVPLFTPSGEITFSADWNRKGFLKEIISHLTSKLYLLHGKSIAINNELYQELLYLNKIFIEENYQWQFNVGPLGGGRGTEKQVNLPQITEAKLYYYYRDLVSTIMKLNHGGIILHFDNLELLCEERLEDVQRVFEDIRDILQVPNVYSIFVGKTGFFNKVIGPLERVRSIFFGWPIFLKPLSQREVLDIFRIRYEFLSSNKLQYLPPVEEDLILYLYDLYQGRIRFIMNGIHGILANFPIPYPETLPTSKSKKLLQILTAEKIRNILSERELEVLLEMVQRGEFSNVELATSLGIKRQNISKYIKKLQQTRYISFIRKEGRKSIYQVSDEIRYLKKMMIKTTPFRKSSFSPTQKLNLNQRQRQFLESVSTGDCIKTSEYAKIFAISSPTALKDLNHLERTGYLQRQGKRKGSYYRVLNNIKGAEKS